MLPGITAIMVSPVTTTMRPDPVYEALMSSPHWIRIYDGGNAVLFGRADLSSPDFATFEKHSLEPEKAVFARRRACRAP